MKTNLCGKCMILNGFSKSERLSVFHTVFSDIKVNKVVFCSCCRHEIKVLPNGSIGTGFDGKKIGCD